MLNNNNNEKKKSWQILWPSWFQKALGKKRLIFICLSKSWNIVAALKFGKKTPRVGWKIFPSCTLQSCKPIESSSALRSWHTVSWSPDNRSLQFLWPSPFLFGNVAVRKASTALYLTDCPYCRMVLGWATPTKAGNVNLEFLSSLGTWAHVSWGSAGINELFLTKREYSNSAQFCSSRAGCLLFGISHHLFIWTLLRCLQAFGHGSWEGDSLDRLHGWMSWSQEP